MIEKKTKKIVGVAIIVILLLSIGAGITSSTTIENKTSGQENKQVLRLPTYTHRVLAEEITATWCQWCPYVMNVLHNEYTSGQYDFNYVALVDDMNTYASQRRVELGVSSFPYMVYDGGYVRIEGWTGSATQYNNALNTCGARTVANINLTLGVTWLGNAQLGVTLQVKNNDASAYSGHIHAYVTEINSRWSNQYDGQYHFAMIGNYAINQNVNVNAGQTITVPTTWNGNAYGMGDIVPENIMVIATVFRTGTNYVDETTSSLVTDDINPDWQNQGQSKDAILRGGSVSLYAQGKDNAALNWSILATNESGTWQNISGKYGSPMNMGNIGGQWLWSNFTWQNPDIPQGRRIGWKIYYVDKSGNWNVTNVKSFDVLSNPVIVDQTAPTATTGDPFTFSASITDDQGVAAAYVEYWYGGGAHTNVSMTPAGGSYYTRTITIPAHSLDALHYIISAKDTLNYWSNTGEKQVVILDNDNPEWRGQGQSNAMVAPGGSVSLYAQGYDNVALKWAWLATNETGEWLTFSGRGWWNLDWRYSKQITIDHTKVSADLTNFPVLISITSSDFITHAQPDGDDFVFIDSTNTTKYNHEIENYDSATGEFVAWVTVPLVSSSEDTVFYLYYGNLTCTNQQNVVGTWDANYLMVHHLKGASYMELDDSTSNHWDVSSAYGNPGYNQAGKIGKCVDLDPAVAWDSLRTGGFNLPTNSTYTGSAWIYVDGNPTSIRYVFEGNNSRGISLVVNSDKKVYAMANTNNGLRSTHGETIVDASNPQWVYVCTRTDTLANRLDVFVNGVSENYTALNGAIVPVNFGLNVGASQSNTSRMNGRIDELRISNIPRTDAWINTEYTMMSSPSSFITVGNEWLKDGGSKYGSPLYMNGVNNQWAWSNFTWQNPSIPEGTRVGWRIYYVDTSNNIIVTDIMSFNITTQTPVNPPLKPTDATPWHQSDNRDLNKGICGRNHVHATYTYTTTSTNTGQIYYKFYWGDGTNSGWLGPYTSGQVASASHSWTNASLGDNQITAICKVNDVESTSSPALTVRMYRLGDISANNITGFDDINPFVLQLASGKGAYYTSFANGYWFTGDVNLDIEVNFGDINPFVALLTSG